MEQVAIQLLLWASGVLSVKAQAFDGDADATMRVKAAQACIEAVARAPLAPAEGDVIAPPPGGLPDDHHAQHNWLMRRAAEGSVSGGVAKVLFYDHHANTAIILHSAPRWQP